MTENEAIKVFKELLDVPCEMLVKYDSVTTEEQKKALVKIRVAEDMAIKALEEIQQYRAIGTVEEFKALKEKSVAKEPIIIDKRFQEVEWKCPVCGLNVIEEPPCQEYCQRCGNKLGWSE